MEGFERHVLAVEDLGGEHVVGEVLLELEEDLVAGDRLFGVVDHDDLLLDLFVGNREDGALGDGLEMLEDDALDLVGADAVAAGLDHVVLAGDEVDVALFVGVDVVAAGDDDLVDELPFGVDDLFEDLDALEAFGGLFGGVPVAAVDARTPVDQLAHLSGLARFALVVDDVELHVGDRLADGARADVDLPGVEVGGAEGFGEAVHGVEVGVGEVGGDVFDHQRRDVAARGADDPDAAEVSGVGDAVGVGVEHPGDVDRHQRQDRHLVVDEMVEKVRTQGEAVQRQGRAPVEGRKDLVEAVVEVEREDPREHILVADAEVAADDPGAVGEGAVVDDDSFGVAGGAEAVGDDGVGVAADIALQRPPADFADLGEGDVGFVGGGVGDDGAGVVDGFDVCDLVLVGEEAGDGAVVDDVADLLGFEESGDGDQDVGGGEDGQDGDDLIEALLGVDPDAAPFGQIQAVQVDGDLVHLVEELGVAESRVAVAQGGFVGPAFGGVFEEASDGVDGHALSFSSDVHRSPRVQMA